ncbi:TetR/AcrR family transcriptional regulator [Lentibacillus salinarum]|uniref:TetR/AcrR family transcriptional regulator n=1 Tax=Lentibacillus salinarum TaxID=446820 RepID=A0ABW3ZY26_9BACI
MSTKKKIKLIAARLYAEKGFKGMTLKEIADEAGIKPPSIYAFYSGKKDLFLQTYKEILDDHLHLLKGQFEHRDTYSARETLHQILLIIMTYHMEETEKTKMFIRLMLFPPSFLKEDISEYFHNLENMERRMLKKIFDEGITNEEIQFRDTEALVTAYLCLLDGLFLETQYYDKEEFFRRLESIWEQYWAGIAVNRNC